MGGDSLVRRVLVAVMMSPGVLIVSPRQASSQTTDLPVGTRVRIELSRRIEGSYVGRRADSLLVVEDQSHDTVRAPVAAILKTERSLGVHGTALKGMGYGFIGGAALGALFGAVISTQPHNGEQLWNLSRLQQTAGVALIVAVVGVPTGAFFGALNRSERWQTVRDPRFGFGLLPPGPFCRGAASCGTRIAAYVKAF